jgi:hypothetical protein
MEYEAQEFKKDIQHEQAALQSSMDMHTPYS